MTDTHRISLAQANTIVDTALAAGRKANMQPLTVVVLDAGGHVICCKREDNSSIMRFEIASGKAWGSLGMGRPSRGLEQVALQRPHFVQAAIAASGGRMVPVAGGVLVINKAGETIGAVGVSGDTSDNDELCAIEGIRAAGLVSNPLEPTKA